MGLRHSDRAAPLLKDSRVSASSVVNDELRTAVAVEVERILQSSEFRHSEQSKRFLRYLVEHSLEGRQELLKERAIGAALFGLETGYDTNESPIVRVRANEIRKRLAKFYSQNAPVDGLRLGVPAGAYRVEFRSVSESAVSESETQIPPPAARGLRRWAYPAAAFVLLAAAAMWWVGRSPDALSEFWRPALDSPSPVIICIGHPVVYRLSREFQDRTRGAGTDHFHMLTDVLSLSPDQALSGKDIVTIQNQYVGIGSAVALARIHGWLGEKHKDSEMRFGTDLSFTDLKKAPAVLIAAFQNRWTIEFTHGLRFVFEGRNPVVRDTKSGKVWSLPGLKENGETDEDYLVISRVFHSESGQFVVAAAGITQYGTQSAGDILTSASLLREGLKDAKPGWQRRNLQLLYHIRVIGQTPGPPALIAMYEW